MRRGAALALLLLAGCAKDLAQLTPFACAADGTCPASYVCVRGTGCVAASSLASIKPFPCTSGACPASFTCIESVGCVQSSQLGALPPFPCGSGCPAGFACIPHTGCVASAHLPSVAPFACAADGTCPAPFLCLAGTCDYPEPCNPLAPTCPDPQRPHCALVEVGGALLGECVHANGPGVAGATCERDGGVDDCGPGLACTGGNCRPFCGFGLDAGAPCASGELCERVPGPDGGAAFGRCAALCSGLGDNVCRAGITCRPLALADGGYTSTCSDPGPAPLEGACALDEQCSTELACASGTCAALCDASHACPSGRCQELPGLANQGGHCSP